MLSIYLFFSLTFPFLSITYASQKIKHIVLKVKRKFPHMTRTYDDVLSILIALENSQKCLKALYCKDWSRFYQSEEGKNKNNPPTFHPSRQVVGAQRLEGWKVNFLTFHQRGANHSRTITCATFHPSTR